jgi:hypothetical protein
MSLALVENMGVCVEGVSAAYLSKIFGQASSGQAQYALLVLHPATPLSHPLHKPRYMGLIIREDIEIELCPDSIIKEDGFSLSK